MSACMPRVPWRTYIRKDIVHFHVFAQTADGRILSPMATVAASPKWLLWLQVQNGPVVLANKPLLRSLIILSILTSSILSLLGYL